MPVSKRQDRPNAIVWLVRNHPELKDPQIIRLVGTTKPTIEKIKERTHTNISNFQPVDPVALGLCTQTDLDNEVEIAALRIKKEGGEMPKPAGTLLPTSATTTAANVNPFDTPQTPAPSGMGARADIPTADDAKREAADVFANFPNKKEEDEKTEGDDKAK